MTTEAPSRPSRGTGFGRGGGPPRGNFNSRPSTYSGRGGSLGRGAKSVLGPSSFAPAEKNAPLVSDTDWTTEENVSGGSEELSQLKNKYAVQLRSLKEVFSDWTTEDLVYVLQEADGDVEKTTDRITGGFASQWETKRKGAKDKTKSKIEAPAMTTTTRGRGRGGNSERGIDRAGVRGRGDGRGRGRGRGDGSFRGGRAERRQTTPDAVPAANTDTPSAWGIEDATPTSFEWSNEPSNLNGEGEPETVFAKAPNGVNGGNPEPASGEWNVDDSTSTSIDNSPRGQTHSDGVISKKFHQAAKSRVIDPNSKRSWASILKPSQPKSKSPQVFHKSQSEAQQSITSQQPLGPLTTSVSASDVSPLSPIKPHPSTSRPSTRGQIYQTQEEPPAQTIFDIHSSSEPSKPRVALPQSATPQQFQSAPLTSHNLDMHDVQVPGMEHARHPASKSLAGQRASPIPALSSVSVPPPGLSQSSTKRSPSFSKDNPVIMPGTHIVNSSKALGLQFGSLDLNPPEGILPTKEPVEDLATSTEYAPSNPTASTSVQAEVNWTQPSTNLSTESAWGAKPAADDSWPQPPRQEPQQSTASIPRTSPASQIVQPIQQRIPSGSQVQPPPVPAGYPSHQQQVPFSGIGPRYGAAPGLTQNKDQYQPFPGGYEAHPQQHYPGTTGGYGYDTYYSSGSQQDAHRYWGSASGSTMSQQGTTDTSSSRVGGGSVIPSASTVTGAGESSQATSQFGAGTPSSSAPTPSPVPQQQSQQHAPQHQQNQQNASSAPGGYPYGGLAGYPYYGPQWAAYFQQQQYNQGPYSHLPQYQQFGHIGKAAGGGFQGYGLPGANFIGPSAAAAATYGGTTQGAVGASAQDSIVGAGTGTVAAPGFARGQQDYGRSLGGYASTGVNDFLSRSGQQGQGYNPSNIGPQQGPQMQQHNSQQGNATLPQASVGDDSQNQSLPQPSSGTSQSGSSTQNIVTQSSVSGGDSQGQYSMYPQYGGLRPHAYQQFSGQPSHQPLGASSHHQQSGQHHPQHQPSLYGGGYGSFYGQHNGFGGGTQQTTQSQQQQQGSNRQGSSNSWGGNHQ